MKSDNIGIDVMAKCVLDWIFWATAILLAIFFLVFLAIHIASVIRTFWKSTF